MRRILVYAVVGVVVAMALWFTGRGDRPATPMSTPAPTGTVVEPQVEDTTPADGRHGDSDDEQGHRHDNHEGPDYPAGLPAEAAPALAAVIADPARSDLRPDLFAELSAMGAAVLRADVTGEGRQYWPWFWATGGAPCCRNLAVHASGAHWAGVPGRVTVRVLWSAERIGGDSIRYRESQVPLHLGEAGWMPG